MVQIKRQNLIVIEKQQQNNFYVIIRPLSCGP